MALSIQMVFALILMTQTTLAYDPTEMSLDAEKVPAELEGIGIDEKLGTQVDSDLNFFDEDGKEVRLREFLGTRPVVMSLVYYSCQSLCNFHLNGLIDVLKTISWTAGNEFDVLAISFDSNEASNLDMVRKKREAYLKEYNRSEHLGRLHFLTGTQDQIQKLTQSVGFRFKWDSASKQWAHASAAILLTPGGMVSRYLHGVSFSAQNMKLALLEAANGKIGNLIDNLVFRCFRYDPTKSRYTIYAFNIMRMGGLIFVALLGIILLPLWIRERLKSKVTKE